MLAMLRFTLLGSFCTAAAAATAAAQAGNHRSKLRNAASSFVRTLEFEHRLRVCNAYPFAEELKVYRGKKEALTAQGAMKYKACQEFAQKLRPGDKLDFKVGDASTGTFFVGDLPENDAVLLLVIHRHDALSTEIAFESHVFANMAGAQVAILDTYKGVSHSSLQITERAPPKDATGEELRYDSVVVVNPGAYDVALVGQDGKVQGKTELVALDRESYVVLRTGVEPKQGAAFPQELVVFPKSDEKSLPHKGAAVGLAPATATLAALVALLAGW